MGGREGGGGGHTGGKAVARPILSNMVFCRCAHAQEGMHNGKGAHVALEDGTKTSHPFIVGTHAAGAAAGAAVSAATTE
jgi:hypothetical protein